MIIIICLSGLYTLSRITMQHALLVSECLWMYRILSSPNANYKNWEFY